MNYSRNRVTANATTIHHSQAYYGDEIEEREGTIARVDERLYPSTRRRNPRLSETTTTIGGKGATTKKLIPRDSFDFGIPRSPSLQSRGTSDFTDTNYESSEETTSEDGYYSGDSRPVFVHQTTAPPSLTTTNNKTPVIIMPRKQLSVPEVRHRSHSTPSSPEIHYTTKESTMFAQRTLVTLSPYNDGASSNLNSNYRRVEQTSAAAFRKHSYGGREIHQTDEIGDDFGQIIRRSPELSSTGSVRRRLPPTPNQITTTTTNSKLLLSASVSNQQPNNRKPPLQSIKSAGCLFGSTLDVPSPPPPPLKPTSKSLDHQQSVQVNPNLLQLPDTVDQNNSSQQQRMLARRGTGRRLPQVPDFSRKIKTEGYHKQALDDEMANAVRPCQTPPPPSLSRTSFLSTSYQPDLHMNGCSSPHSRKLCQRRTSDQSIEQYVGVPCTCTSPSTVDNLESKSSSDTEDHGGMERSNERANSITSSCNAGDHDLDSGIEGTNSTSSFTHTSWTDVDKSLSVDEKDYGLGHILFSMQYFSVRKRLRVSINKAEGLAGRLKPDLELNTFVKVCLMPGKVQKQHGTRIVKGSRDAFYNEEFFFDNIGMEDIKNFTLAIFVCHHVGKQFQKDVVIGEVEVPLNTISKLFSKQEIKIQRELHPKLLKKLGRIRISSCLECDARRLTINVFRVDDLPKFGITGAPDPCVKITVDQNGRIQTKQTRTLKSTCHAVFKEAVMFLVSVRPDDLDNADISISVMDMAREDAIGHVYLGIRAKEKSEIDQWKNTVQYAGKEFKATHSLRRDDA